MRWSYLKLLPIGALIVLLAFSLCAPWYCIIENPSKTGIFITTTLVLSMLGLATYYIVLNYREENMRLKERTYRKGTKAAVSTSFTENIVSIIFVILVLVSIVAYLVLTG